MIRAGLQRCAALTGLLLCGVLVAGPSSADIPVPELQSRVIDLTDTLGVTQRGALESRLAAFERESGSQVAVLLVPTTQPESVEQYSIRVVDAWKLGRAEQDDGVLLLIAKDDRALRIEVGRGLEGAIPDAVANRVIEEIIVPRFREDDFPGGVEAGVEQILGLIRGESLPPPQAASAADGDALGQAFPLVFGLIMVGQLLRRSLGALPGAALVGGGAFALGWWLTGFLAAAIFLALLGFVLTLFGMNTTGGYGGSRGGFGGGGGGFRGGGGSFGGGGASGRW